MMKKILLVTIILISAFQLKSQNLTYVRQLIDTLCSESMFGRGFEFKGDSIAADFLSKELKNNRVKCFGEDYYQNLSFPVNTFEGNMFVEIDNIELNVGIDYLILPSSSSCKGTYEIAVIDKNLIKNERKFNTFKSRNHSNQFILIDTVGLNDKSFKDIYKKIVEENLLNAKGIIVIENGNLTHSVSTEVKKFPVIVLKRESLPKTTSEIIIDIENKFIAKYDSKNVIGYIKGATDTFIVLTAHYDHLGTLGQEVYFPGAHDNASGVSLCMDLIKTFANRKSIPHYSIAVIFFTGEELGLLGSGYYVENPVFPLKNIKFLLNLDLAGSGEDGIQIVNSTIFTKQFDLLTNINKENDFMKTIKSRGAAANSDHYFFYEAGVPSFFIYTLGAYKEYHNIYDKSDSLPLNDYEDYFRLLQKFIEEIN